MHDRDWISHYGVPGMHWGRRKARTSVDTSSSDHKEAQKIKKKKLHEMSNDDLVKLTRRMQLERNYKDLSSRDISIGRKLSQDVLTEVGKEILKDSVKSVLKGPLLIGAVAMAVSKLKKKK